MWPSVSFSILGTALYWGTKDASNEQPACRCNSRSATYSAWPPPSLIPTGDTEPPLEAPPIQTRPTCRSCKPSQPPSNPPQTPDLSHVGSRSPTPPIAAVLNPKRQPAGASVVMHGNSNLDMFGPKQTRTCKRKLAGEKSGVGGAFGLADLEAEVRRRIGGSF